MKILKLSLTLCCFTVLTANAQDAFSKAFPLQWKTKIGVTTYRTNMVFRSGTVFIGSNGEDRESRIDPLDGVFCIDGKTGAIKKRYCSPIAGDNDVTGIAIDGNALYCGSDNFDFYCYDITTGLELWKYPLPHDVECVPVLADLNGDGKKDVFFSVEQHGFYALNGVDGSLLWNNDSISSHNGNTSALAIDVNNDGVMDMISAVRGTPNTDDLAGFKMAHYGDYHVAINGKDGSFLWIAETGAGVNSSPYLVNFEGKQCIAVIDTYGEFQLLDLQGNKLFGNDFGYSHYMTPVINSKGVLNLGFGGINMSSKFWQEEIRINEDTGEEEIDHYFKSDHEFFDRTPVLENVEGPVSASAVIADVFGKGVQQFLVPSEDGYVYVIDENGQNSKGYKLPSGAEASFLVKDIDGDGKLEILVADRDGYLSCYATNSKGKVELAGFRTQP